MPFVDLRYRPAEDDVVCKFFLKPAKGVSLSKAAENVALESSVGTWTPVSTMKKRIEGLQAKVFDVREDAVKIAYPLGLFEKGNLPQILSGIAGNIFGMKLVDSLRLEDVDFPEKVVKGFGGPEIGLEGLRRITGVRNRPLAGTIYKPKVGLKPREMAELGYKIYSNGVDYSKDDENLTSMVFNRFEERVEMMLEVVDRIKTEQGRTVIYAPNITGPGDEMARRAGFVKEQGGRCVMVDIITAGWAGLQLVRNLKLRMIIHAHRAGHAMFTRDSRFGMSMLVVAKLARMVGVTGLHTGAVVGKMEGERKEVLEMDKFLRSDWFGTKKVIPIASGGLHPGLIPRVVEALGRDLIINCGGGLWGHPDGPEAGARAIRQAIDAAVKGAGIKGYAGDKEELRKAIRLWGC